MSRRVQGIGASPGRVMGRLRWARSELPRVEHRTISEDEVERELVRFEEAREAAVQLTRDLRERTSERLGDVEAKIFEPQILMLEDPDLVEGTASYISENYLSAERAFDWRILEIRSEFLDSAHAMVLERLADLRDIRLRVMSRLLDLPENPLGISSTVGDSTILSFEDLTPGTAVRLDAGTAAGIVAAGGSRSSHSAVLIRSLGLPAVVGLGGSLREIEDGTPVIIDGGTGRVIVDPTADEEETFRSARLRSVERRRHLEEIAGQPARTTDGHEVVLQVNLDQPGEAEEAVRLGSDGVGLFRSEFLVIGRRLVPDEEEQYEAYRRVVEAFPEKEVTLRTFDIGGDKFPLFLQAPPEENPYLGWRAIRVCLDRPELFRNQLRAALRASRHGDLRILLPFVTSVEEVRRARTLLLEVGDELGLEDPVPLGVMVETPAAVETVDLLAPHVEFLSLGTNDLTQYVVAVDRGNARLADRFDALHPALFRLYGRLREQVEAHGLELGVCGDLATDPVGLAALLGLGYRKFSLPPASYPEVKGWIRSVSAGELETVCADLSGCETAGEIRAPLERYLEGSVPEEAVLIGRLSRPY